MGDHQPKRAMSDCVQTIPDFPKQGLAIFIKGRTNCIRNPSAAATHLLEVLRNAECLSGRKVLYFITDGDEYDWESFTAVVCIMAAVLHTRGFIVQIWSFLPIKDEDAEKFAKKSKDVKATYPEFCHRMLQFGKLPKPTNPDGTTNYVVHGSNVVAKVEKLLQQTKRDFLFLAIKPGPTAQTELQGLVKMRCSVYCPESETTGSSGVTRQNPKYISGIFTPLKRKQSCLHIEPLAKESSEISMKSQRSLAEEYYSMDEYKLAVQRTHCSGSCGAWAEHVRKKSRLSPIETYMLNATSNCCQQREVLDRFLDTSKRKRINL